MCKYIIVFMFSSLVIGANCAIAEDIAAPLCEDFSTPPPPEFEELAKIDYGYFDLDFPIEDFQSEGQVSYEEDFNDGVADQWYFDDQLWYIDSGMLKIDSYYWVGSAGTAYYYGSEFTDVTLQADMSKRLGDGSWYNSLMFSLSSEGRYLFAITPNGEYCLWRNWSDGSGDFLIDWTFSNRLNTGFGVWNRLRVQVNGPNIYLYINDSFVNSYYDVDYLSKGYIGFLSKDEVREINYYDNVFATGIDDGEVLFTWPIDPDNPSAGHFGPCTDWPNKSDGCYWLSDSSEDINTVWRDAQPFQQYPCDGCGRRKRYHLGADYNIGSDAADAGEPVYPAASGTISEVMSNIRGWGNIIFVKHETPDGTYTSMYAHVDWLPSGQPEEGVSVSPDNPIAEVGNGGGLYPYHLHFEIRRGINTAPGPAYTWRRVQEGPQGQIDPNAFIRSFK